jgi:hypothetical protein
MKSGQCQIATEIGVVPTGCVPATKNNSVVGIGFGDVSTSITFICQDPDHCDVNPQFNSNREAQTQKLIQIKFEEG